MRRATAHAPGDGIAVGVLGGPAILPEHEAAEGFARGAGRVRGAALGGKDAWEAAASVVSRHVAAVPHRVDRSIKHGAAGGVLQGAAAAVVRLPGPARGSRREGGGVGRGGHQRSVKSGFRCCAQVRGSSW